MPAKPTRPVEGESDAKSLEPVRRGHDVASSLRAGPRRRCRLRRFRRWPEKLNEDILVALKANDEIKATLLIKSLELPNHAEFFKKTFGDEMGAKIDANHVKLSQNMTEGLLKSYKAQLAQNRTNVTAYKLTDPESKDATGLQSGAMKAMKEKVPLYGVRLIEPGKDAGMHYWSFVYVDGGFRMIGKMNARAAEPAPAAK